MYTILSSITNTLSEMKDAKVKKWQCWNKACPTKQNKPCYQCLQWYWQHNNRKFYYQQPHTIQLKLF